MISNVGAFAAAAVHPLSVTPAASTLDATHKFLATVGNDYGAKPSTLEM